MVNKNEVEMTHRDTVNKNYGEEKDEQPETNERVAMVYEH